MPPLDWDRVMGLKAADVDEEAADDLFDMFVKYDPGKENEAERLRQLFRLTQSVMKIKHELLEELMAEMESQAKAEGKNEGKKEAELFAKIDDLEKENRELKRFGTDTNAPRDTRVLRDEIRDLEQQNEALQREIKDIQRDLGDEKRATERYSSRNAELEKELNELRRDNDQMRQDISDYKMQLQSQRDNINLRRGDDAHFREKMAKKNHELAQALEELQNLTDVNEALQAKCDDLQAKLTEAIQDMDRNTEDYIKLKAVLQQSDSVTDKLREENEILKAQNADLTEQVRAKTDADDEIMVAVNNKIEEWKSILSAKDDEIVEYQEQIFRLRDQLIAANMDTDKTTVATLSQVVKEKDEQIEMLTEQLKQVTNEMEANASVIDDLRDELNKGGLGASERLQYKLRELQTSLRDKEGTIHSAVAKATMAESDAKEKDKELSEALERMRQYEAGEYGLAEAVAEIKECKAQIKVRDRQIEELTQHVNKCELKFNDLLDENENLRERLGLDPREPVDVSEFRKDKDRKKEETKALNIILQKEVERLEEERLELKQKIRRLAQQTGQRAVALGLEAEDMMAIQDFTEELKTRKVEGIPSEVPFSSRSIQPLSSAARIHQEVQGEEMALRNQQLGADLSQNFKQIDQLHMDNVRYKARYEELENHNKQLEQGMREIMTALKEKNEGQEGEMVIQCPSLDKMLAAIEARNLVGNYDTSLYLKAQVDNLQGRNDELRAAFREIRLEASKTKLELDKTWEKVEKLEADNKVLRETGLGGGLFQALPLPGGMAVTSSEVISSLNEHLVVSLQEMSLKEEMVVKMESALENYRRKFAVMRHQQGLLYQDYIKDKKEWDEEVGKLKEKLSSVEGYREEDKVKLQEFDRLLDTLSHDDVEVRRRLSEMTRKVTVLRVNEKALTRRYQTMEEVQGTLRKDNNQLKNEMIQMEKAVAERLGYLQRHKDMAVFKIAALQKALEDSVPTEDLEKANKEFHELTEKYRDMLEKGNSLVEKTEALTGLEEEVKRLSIANEELKKTLEIEKERRYTLEGAMEDLQSRGVTKGSGVMDQHVVSISKKLTMLEMKELNERQRAEHAVRMYEQQKDILHNLEQRNSDLEKKFAEVTKINLEAQKVERDLRDELATCVTKAVSDADRKKISNLEEDQAKMKQEISKLKEIAEVASSQVSMLETQQVSRDKEVRSLRQQLLDFQVQSDEKTIIGKLHRHIVQLQISEGTAVRKLEESRKKNSKLEAQVVRLEQRLDDKDQTIYHNRVESQNKQKYLKQSLQELRRQFAGAVPLSRQEKFSKAMAQLQQDKLTTEKDLKLAKEQRLATEDKLAALELQHTSLQDLIATLKDGRGAQKVMEWHSKMDILRLEELRQKRQINRLQQQIKYQEGLVRTHEATIQELEAENVKLTKMQDDKQLRWEQREVELERAVANMERHTAEIAGAASQFEEAVGSIPDSSLPVANQLEMAITTIKSNVKLILDTKAENAANKKRVQELEAALKEAERTLLARDKLVSEMRLRMPATADRDDFIQKATQRAEYSTPLGSSKQEEYESQQAFKVAQSTIASLQARIATKEETIQKYQDLLKQARDDMQEMNRKHETELKVMQQKIHMSTDAAFNRFKEAAKEMLHRPTADLPSNKQLRRLNELEDMVAEQDNNMAVMAERLRHKETDIVNLKVKIQDVSRELIKEKEKQTEEYKVTCGKLEDEIEEYKREMAAQRKEIQILNDEIAALKEANTRAPTVTMKNLVERLKNQLALKEKQHQALSKALTELRADMVTQAQETVKARSEGHQVESNVQVLLEKHTKELQTQVEEIQNQNQRLKKEIRKKKDSESTLHNEMEELRDEMSRKESAISRLKSDKHRLEQDVEELEKKIERMHTMRSQKSENEAKQREVDELRRRVKLLEDELKRKSQQPEKPFEEPRDKKADELARWEESKKWQKTVDKMKSKLREKDSEIERLLRGNELMKNALDRAQREGIDTKAPIRPVTTAPLRSVLGKPEHELEDLRQKNYLLEEEVMRLQRKLTMEKDVSMTDLQLRNAQLNDQLQHMEKVLTAKVSSSEGPGTQAYQELYNKYQDSQRKVLKLSEENLEMKFELEQNRKHTPRLRERVDDLQKYVDALKLENAELSGNASARSSLLSVGSNIRRIGESGKSTRELEKTIALLKKVVERVQAENEQLKKAPGVVSSEQLAMLKRENDGLKSQLGELRENMGSALSERYTSQQKGTAKIMSDYEKLRKSYMKEKDVSEKLRVELKTVELERDQLMQDKQEAESKLESETSKKPGSDGLESKAIKSSFLTRKLEDKVKSLELDVQKKGKEITDLKAMLRDAASVEQQLVEEKQQLLEKVSVLESLPGGSQMTDAAVMREYQQTRLRVERLEKDKAELLHEVGLYREKKHGNADLPGDDILSKASGYDRVMRENVEVRMQLKSALLEKDKLRVETDKLRKELENFGPDFFEEIEDLKYNYKEAVQKNVLYEDKLHQISRQFGISLDLPGV